MQADAQAGERRRQSGDRQRRSRDLELVPLVEVAVRAGAGERADARRERAP